MDRPRIPSESRSIVQIFPGGRHRRGAQLVVPQQEYANILKEYHDAPTTGHYGVDHTLRRVRKNYF
jgi:hypothetical protein